jgi:hypothetical protein
MDACGADEIASIGGGCVAVGARDDCAAGTWGDIPTTPTPIYVDAASTSTSPDGSATDPYTTIAEAVAAAPTDAPSTIAIAGGVYIGSLTLDRPVTLHGRCPGMVNLGGTSGQVVEILADGAALRGLTVDASSVTYGILVDGATDVILEDLVIGSAGEVGVVGLTAEVTARRISMDGIGGSSSAYGDGFQFHPETGTTCSLAVSGSDIQNLVGDAIYTHECDLDVRDTRMAHAIWEGIRFECPSITKTLWVSGCEIFDTLAFGILVGPVAIDPPIDSPTITRNHVHDIPFDPYFEISAGIWLESGLGMATVTENLVESTGVDVEGLSVLSQSALIASNLVRDVGSAGIAATTSGAEMTVTDNTVDTCVFGGISMGNGGAVSVERNVVRNVSHDAEGTSSGIIATGSGTVTMRRNHAGSTGGGLWVSDAASDVVIEENLVSEGYIGLYCEVVPDGVVTIEHNRILDSPFSLFASEIATATIAGNTVGPVTTTWDGEVGGMLLSILRDATIRDNAIHHELPGDEQASYGIVSMDVSGEIRSNHVQGNPMVGLAYEYGMTGEPDVLDITSNTITSSRGIGLCIEGAPEWSSIAITSNRISAVSDGLWWDGLSYGDGIAILASLPSAEILIDGNTLLRNHRSGIFGSSAAFTAMTNVIALNAVSLAWQDGSDVTATDNVISCNASDQPWVDAGMSVPDPPELSMPGL